MTAEDVRHLTELRTTHIKRLHLLEKQKARDGYETQPKILLEIDEINAHISAIEQKLNAYQTKAREESEQMNQTNDFKMLPAEASLPAENQPNLSPDFAPSSSDKQVLRIEILGDFDKWTPDLQNSLVRVIAALMDVPQQTVRVVKREKGSVILWIEVPRDAAERLLNLYTNDISLFDELDIRSIVPQNVDEATASQSNQLKPVRVILADDHAMFRRGVAAVLEGYSDQVQVIGEASNIEDTVRMTQELAPDLVLFDLQMPERRGSLKQPTWEQGIAAIQRLRALETPPRLLVLSFYEDATILFAALRAGAHGYVTKGDSYDGAGLADAIRRAVGGEAIYGAVVAQRIREYHQQLGSENIPLAERLTPRDQEVLELLSEHKSNQDIAKELYISVKTVKTHVANILDKLQLIDQLINQPRRQGAWLPRNKPRDT